MGTEGLHPISIDELPEYLDGVCGVTSLALLALHAMNVRERKPSGEVFEAGTPPRTTEPGLLDRLSATVVPSARVRHAH